MDEKTRTALAEIVRAFYTEFADDFAASRRRWPPGFERILPHLRPAANVLDVGCGNGRLLTFLSEAGWQGRYVGVDSSAKLLAVASRVRSGACFLQADLLEPGWAAGLTTGFDAVAALAVLHHIPAVTYRVRLVAQCAELLRPRGIFIVSTWQFLGTPRLRTRILPWSRVGLKDEDVEPGDYLLSWGAGAAGQRYCAAIGEEDLRLLATEAGLAPVEMLYADGHEGNLSLYGVFRKLSAT